MNTNKLLILSLLTYSLATHAMEEGPDPFAYLCTQPRRVPSKSELLLTAAAAGNRACVQALINDGADVNHADEHGNHNTPLICAAQDGHLGVLECLLDNKADIDKVDETQASALITAIKNQRTLAAILLIHRGADTNLQGSDHKTALMWAIQLLPANPTMASVIVHLLKKAPRVNLKDNANKTALNYTAEYLVPFHVSVEEVSVAIARLLLKLGAIIDNQDQNGVSPLMSAAGNNNIQLMRLLLEQGAAIDLVNNIGMPLDMIAHTPAAYELIDAYRH